MLETVIEAGYHTAYSILDQGKGKIDREIPHEKTIKALEVLDGCTVARRILGVLFDRQHPNLASEIFGVRTKNPFMVAAGMDKNAKSFLSLCEAFGFGGVETGTTTLLAWPGNQRPRVYSSPADHALINCMGFPGEGITAVRRRLIRKLKSGKERNYLIGCNIGAPKPSFEAGTQIEDIKNTFIHLAPFVDYIVENLSTPNTLGVRGLLERGALHDVLSATDPYRQSDSLLKKPTLLKLSPDMTFSQIDSTIEEAYEHHIDGFVLVNTSTDPSLRVNLRQPLKDLPGGLSGAPLKDRSLLVNHYVYQKTQGDFVIFRVGGLEDAYDCLDAVAFGGADRLQFFSTLVMPDSPGPLFIRKLVRRTANLMQALQIPNLAALKGRPEMLPWQAATKQRLDRQYKVKTD